MISSTNYSLTLTYQEVAALEEHLDGAGSSLELITNGCSFTASAHGIGITFGTPKRRDKVWELVLTATDDKDNDTDENNS